MIKFSTADRLKFDLINSGYPIKDVTRAIGECLNNDYISDDAFRSDVEDLLVQYKRKGLHMEKYVRIINKDKESGAIKSVECFPVSYIQCILFDSMEDENHKRFYYVKILTTMGSSCVCTTRRKDECYDAFECFYSWLLDDESESNEFVFTIDRKEINDYFKNCFF